MNNFYNISVPKKDSRVDAHSQDLVHNAQSFPSQVPARTRSESRRLYDDNFRRDVITELSDTSDICNETSPLRKANLGKLQLEENDRYQPQQASNEFLQTQLQKSLEERLLEAGLMSASQLALVRMDQQTQPDLAIADILELRNWYSETVLHFFNYLETSVNEEFCSLSIGQRLKGAGLLDDAQLEIALEYKRQANIRLGHAIFLSGVLNQATVDYFAQF